MIVPGSSFNIWPVAAPDTGCIVPWQSDIVRPVVPVTAGDSILLYSGATVIAPISGLFYNGNYGGCDECGRRINALGTWPDGFRPTTMRMTIAVLEDKTTSGYNPSPFSFLSGYTDDFNMATLSTAGTYTIDANINGNVDITAFILYLGIRTGGAGGDDVAFIIGDIGFDCP